MKPQRTALASFAASQKADDAHVVAQLADTSALQPKTRKYPHVSVYLRPDEIKTLKLLSIDMEVRVNEICAVAIREWMERNGHA